MFEHVIQVRENAHEIFGFDPSRRKVVARAMSKPFKKGYKAAAFFWYKNFLPRHFTRSAYGFYRGAYLVRKRKGAPMVKTGTLRDRVTKLSHAKITSTGNGARIRIPYGRPSGMDKDEMRAKTLRLMKKRRISFEQAQQIVFNNAGFSRAAKESFQRDMTATNQKEEKAMAETLRDFVKNQINTDVRFRQWRVKA